MNLSKIFKIFEKRKKTKTESWKEGQKATHKFFLFAFLLFGLQGIVSNIGAIETFWPDLPSPISFASGRAVHLNISLFWPLIGTIGAAYFFFLEENQRGPWHLSLINWHFWLTSLIIMGLLIALSLGWTEGREYLEAPWPFKIAILGSLFMFFFILISILLKVPFKKWKPASVAILLGSISLVVFFIPNLFFYHHPTVDEFTKFWVVHLWEELSFELLTAGILTIILVSLTNVPKKDLEKLLYIDLAIIVGAGLLGTGHHYYWIGTPGFWLWIGTIFSLTQLVPIILIVGATYKAYKNITLPTLASREGVTYIGLISSVFHHVTGAGILGMFMAIPKINLYVHGTYMTSAHSHLALFGVLGFLTLSYSYFVLFREIKVPKKTHKTAILSMIILNLGLLTMGTALFLAGGLQAYLWRGMGMDFMEVQLLLEPYLIVRSLGGLIYGVGAVLLTWIIFANYIKARFNKLPY